MRFVMPITDKRAVTDIAEYLYEKNERDYVLFMTGIYLGRRISDLLEYRVRIYGERTMWKYRRKRPGTPYA